MPTSFVAAAAFVAAFAVADLTGVRALGGVLLLAAGAWCFARWRHATSTGRAAGLVGFAAAAFVASHPLADVLGAWGAVLLVATLVGIVAWALGGDRDAARRRRGP